MKNATKSMVVSILTALAKITLRRFKPKIIAVTGSVGKTSTKDAIHAIVSGAFEARKSRKSMNSDIGLPLAIFGLESAWNSPFGWLLNVFRAAEIAFLASDFPDWLILEIGADHPGDIEKIGKWLKPDITVLTRMAEIPVHIEFFKDKEEVLHEKMFLARALKQNGALVVNADDRIFMEAVKDIPAKKILYGFDRSADVKIVRTETTYNGSDLPLPRGQYGIFEINGTKERVECEGIVGRHLLYPLAAAAAVGMILGIHDDLPAAFSFMERPKGRMRLIPGKSKSVVIDDTYNSSPVACEEALRALEEISVKGKKIAVLGDMKELGEYSETTHREIGRQAGEFLHSLVTVGETAEWFRKGALEAGMATERISHYETAEEAAIALGDLARGGDVILVKGSQSMRMEKIVVALMEDRSKAPELLVRQEKEWQNR